MMGCVLDKGKSLHILNGTKQGCGTRTVTVEHFLRHGAAGEPLRTAIPAMQFRTDGSVFKLICRSRRGRVSFLSSFVISFMLTNVYSATYRVCLTTVTNLTRSETENAAY